MRKAPLRTYVFHMKYFTASATRRLVKLVKEKLFEKTCTHEQIKPVQKLVKEKMPALVCMDLVLLSNTVCYLVYACPVLQRNVVKRIVFFKKANFIACSVAIP